jgi:hypothetical protein
LRAIALELVDGLGVREPRREAAERLGLVDGLELAELGGGEFLAALVPSLAVAVAVGLLDELGGFAAVVICHGRAENVGDAAGCREDLAEALAAAGELV